MGRRRAIWLSGLALAMIAFASTTAQEEQLVAEESSGIIPVDQEVRLAIRGIVGDVSVRAGRPGEVRFLSFVPGSQTTPLPVAVWLSGSRFKLLPPQGAETQRRALEVTVPASLFVEIEASGGRILVSGLKGGAEIRADGSDIDVRTDSGGPVHVDLAHGKAALAGIGGELSLRVRDGSASVTRIEGGVTLVAESASVEIGQVRGALEASDLRDSTLKIAEVLGTVRIRAKGGTIDARGLAQGAEMSLTGTRLVLQKCKGDLDIETDSDVRFQDLEAALHVNGYGASVHGSGQHGLLEIRTEAAAVAVDRIGGPTRIQGSGLKVDLRHIAAELFVDAHASEVNIDDPSGELTVLADGGNVTVSNASQKVEIRGRLGEVRVHDLRGSLQLEVEAERVEVAWAGLYPTKDSLVKNDGGDVEMRFPANAGVRVVAETQYGRIESSLPGTKVNDGASSAQVELGFGTQRTTIRVVAEGDIVLSTGRFGQDGQ